MAGPSPRSPRSLPRAGEPAPEATPVGPAWLALGFRPFFLFAGAFATVVVPLWLFSFFGRLTLPLRVPPASWHAHEMIFGFVVAVIAGFLLTAVRNWTSQPTPSGSALGGLVLLWTAGRVAFTLGALLPQALVVAIDVAFLPVFALSIGLPIVRTKNWRNLAFVPLLLLMDGANLAFHLTTSMRPLRLAMDVILLIVLIVGGRVIPMFTGNAIGGQVPGRPALAWASVVAMAPVAALELFEGTERGFAFAAIAAGVLVLLRMHGWQTWKARAMPIVWVLHVSWAWLGIGLILRGVAAVRPTWMASAPLHVLAVGAISTMILGMMTRVSLGHTGRMLVVARTITFAYVTLTLATVLRGLVPLVRPASYAVSLMIAGACWAIAFALFTAVYFRILTTPRVDGKPG